MSQLPLADATPLRVTGILFKDLVFAFEPQDIPDGARTVRMLRGNSATIVDEMEDASIILVDPEHPCALDLLRQAASKVVLHYSWVNKSLIAGHPLVESSNWGDCQVTPDNINCNFGYIPPPPSSNPQLQTPRPTPENRSYNVSMPSRFLQSSAGITPPYTPTPSHWNRDPVMLQQQMPQLHLSSQVASYNHQPIQSQNLFAPFPTSQPTDTGTMVYGQQSGWSPFHPGVVGMIQPPTLEDVRRAYEVLSWFQRPAMYQQLPPPPTSTQPGPALHPNPPPPTQNPPSTADTQPEVCTAPGTSTTLSRQDSASSHDIFPDLGDPAGPPPGGSSLLPTSPRVQPVDVPPPPPPDNTAGPSTIPTPLHIHPKLFEHDVGKPIMFCIPIILKKRGRIAEIFRATGGGFTDDVEDADYVVLGQWEENYFDEMWYCAQDYNKPTVTPGFVMDSYEKGKLLNPNDYPTRGPEKPRKDEPKRVRSRSTTNVRKRRGKARGGTKAASPRPTSSSASLEESPKWLRFFKEAEHTKSLQYIGAMFKKNAELTHDALAIHLHNKMSNHTINSWKKFCLHHMDVIDDLRRRAISNTEKRTAPEDMDVTETGAGEVTLPTPQQVNPQESQPPQPQLQPQLQPQPQSEPQSESKPQLQPQMQPQIQLQLQPRPQQPQLPPPPPYERVANPGPVSIKTEPLDDDQLDFAFATNVLSGWNANEESDVALWKRMESMRPCTTAPSWEEFCEKHRSRFEHFFANKETNR